MSEFINITWTSASIVGILLLTAMTGYFFSKSAVSSPEFPKLLSRLVFYILLPCLLFTKTATSITPDNFTRLWIFPAAATVYVMLGLLVGVITAKILRLKQEHIRPVIAVLTFQNSGYLPIALTATACTVFPAFKADPQAESEAIACISSYLLASALLAWLIGPPLVAGTKLRDFNWRNVITPPVIGLFAGTTVGLIEPLRSLLTTTSSPLFPVFGTAELLSKGVIPCVLMLLGASMAGGTKEHGVGAGTVIVCIILKLFVMPAIVIGSLYFLSKASLINLSLISILVLVIEGGMPPANNLVVMSELAGGRSRTELAVLMFWHYLASIISITLVIATAMYLFCE